MELQPLRYFVALAQELHFQKAAKRAHVSQPTLSQQLKKLEQEIGLPLFERSSKRVSLTSAGQKFLPHAIGILDLLEKGLQVLREDTKEISGKIRLGVIPTMGPYLLPYLIQEIKKSAPKVRLEFFELTTPLLLAELKEGKLDLGILSSPIEMPGIVSQVLKSEPMFLACAKNHPLAQKRKLSLKEIDQENLLILQEGHCFGTQMLDYCKRSREDDQVIFQGSSLTSVMRLAASGEGVTFVPKMAARANENPGLVFIPLTGTPQREIVAAWRITAQLSRAHQYLMKQVREMLED